ncbi:anaphase-promoting complex subunit 11, partial [Piptocephalis cylindrospora]
WTPVGVWKWDVGDKEDDVCGICRIPFEGCCSQCSEPGDACPVVVGMCTHAYHEHCINSWLKTKNHCPMDRIPW